MNLAERFAAGREHERRSAVHRQAAGAGKVQRGSQRGVEAAADDRRGVDGPAAGKHLRGPTVAAPPPSVPLTVEGAPGDEGCAVELSAPLMNTLLGAAITSAGPRSPLYAPLNLTVPPAGVLSVTVLPPLRVSVWVNWEMPLAKIVPRVVGPAAAVTVTGMLIW